MLKSVSRPEPATNMNKAMREAVKSKSVIGHFRKPFLYSTIHRKIRGGKVKVRMKTDRIPMIETVATDFRAGCWAKINTPIPNNVVITDSRIDTL